MGRRRTQYRDRDKGGKREAKQVCEMLKVLQGVCVVGGGGTIHVVGLHRRRGARFGVNRRLLIRQEIQPSNVDVNILAKFICRLLPNVFLSLRSVSRAKSAVAKVIACLYAGNIFDLMITDLYTA